MDKGEQPTLAMRPMQWSALPELGDALPLDAADIACMEDVRAVLARHGKLDRFALHLAHRHFELEAGEVLIEQPDTAARTQHVTVGRLDDYPHALPTTWLFDEVTETRDASGYVGKIYCVCATTPASAGACIGHRPSATPGPRQQEEEAARNRTIAEEKARYERKSRLPPDHIHDHER